MATLAEQGESSRHAGTEGFRWTTAASRNVLSASIAVRASRARGQTIARRSFADRLAHGERARFVAFLAGFAICCGVIGLWNLLLGVAYGDFASELSGVLVLAYTGIAVAGWHLARRGDVERSGRV